MGVGYLHIYCGFFSLLIVMDLVLMEPSPADVDGMCGNIDVVECLRKVQTFLKITALPFVTEEEQLDELCEDTVQGYNCSQVLYKNPDCLSQRNKDILPIFVSMAEFTFFMLCGGSEGSKGYLRTDYLGYADCLLENRNQLICCAEETGVPDLPVLRLLEESSKNLATREIQTCCPLMRYLKCASKIASDNCGDSAANFTTEYIRRAAGEEIQLVCQKVPHYPDPDPSLCPDPVPVCSGCLSIHIQNNFIFITSVLSILPLFSRIFKFTSFR